MTLSEAKKEWKVSYDTIVMWLEKGFIPDIQIVDKSIIINGIKPFVPKKGVNITVENVRKYILQACMNFEYIDYRIVSIRKEQFRSILLQLEESKYIKRNKPKSECTSNRDFTITDEGEKFLKKGKFRLEKLGFSFNFKYLEMNLEIGENK